MNILLVTQAWKKSLPSPNSCITSLYKSTHYSVLSQFIYIATSLIGYKLLKISTKISLIFTSHTVYGVAHYREWYFHWYLVADGLIDWIHDWLKRAKSGNLWTSTCLRLLPPFLLVPDLLQLFPKSSTWGLRESKKLHFFPLSSDYKRQQVAKPSCYPWAYWTPFWLLTHLIWCSLAHYKIVQEYYNDVRRHQKPLQKIIACSQIKRWTPGN